MSTAAIPTGADYTPQELAIAAFIALSVPVWSIVLLMLSQSGALSDDAPHIVPGEMPIAVKPVVDMDSPLLKLGGKKVRPVLPDRWKKPEPSEQPKVVERKAHVSTKAKHDAEAPPKDLEVSDAGTPPDPDAEVVDQADEENPDADAGSEASGGGSPAGSKDGTETDPLKARAASKYHGRILAFLKAGFSCPKLTDSEPRCSPSASVSISGDGVVTAVSFNACGNAKIDPAANAAIQSKIGQQIPPPPENYPELRPNSFSVAYVCK